MRPDLLARRRLYAQQVTTNLHSHDVNPEPY